MKDFVGVKSKDELGSIYLMTAGAFAGMSYNFAFFPADVVKSQMQSGLHKNSGFLKVATHVYKTWGLKGFYRGCALTLAKSCPTSGAMFLSYELLVREFL